MTDDALIFAALVLIYFVLAVGLGIVVAVGIEWLRPGTLAKIFGNDAGLFKK